jgi:hypothetical protein
MHVFFHALLGAFLFSSGHRGAGLLEALFKAVFGDFLNH